MRLHNRRFPTPIALAFTLGFSAVGSAQQAAGAHGVIRGRISDPRTTASSPTTVIGLVVFVDSGTWRAMTDSAGRFQIDSVPLGPHTIRLHTRDGATLERHVALAAADTIF